MELSPEALFDSFLHRIRQGPIRLLPRALHRLFYEASLRHPEEMRGFDFLVRTEPYSPTLARLVWEFQQADQLGRLNPDFTGYVLKQLGQPIPADDPAAVSRVVDTLLEKLPEYQAGTAPA